MATWESATASLSLSIVSSRLTDDDQPTQSCTNKSAAKEAV